MKVSRFLIVLLCLVGVAAVADDEKDKETKRTEIRQMSQDTLTRLYKVQPSAEGGGQQKSKTNVDGRFQGLVHAGFVEIRVFKCHGRLLPECSSLGRWRSYA